MKIKLNAATIAAAIPFAVMLAITLFGSHAKASEGQIVLTVPITAVHLSHSNIPGTDKPYNNKNYGFGVGYRLQGDNGFDYGIHIGTYDNSYYRRSNYIAVDTGYNFNEYVRAGFLLGLISGYGGNNIYKGYGPLVAPQLEFTVAKHYTVTTTFVPTTIKNGSNAVAFSVGYKW